MQMLSPKHERNTIFECQSTHTHTMNTTTTTTRTTKKTRTGRRRKQHEDEDDNNDKDADDEDNDDEDEAIEAFWVYFGIIELLRSAADPRHEMPLKG